MKKYALLILVVVGSLLLVACGGGGAAAGGTGAGASRTDFPMPGSVSNLTDTGGGSINFQTQMTVEETVSFYRDAFTKAGLTERTINTAITDTTFSLVFDGDASGKAVVVQGVDLGNGTANVNIRYEDV
ncbi:MAG TPA: hypothetical protein VIU38_01995 [Anaerolineales bacterium]